MVERFAPMPCYDLSVGADGEQWVNAWSWVGWINVTHYPLVYIPDLDTWTYVTEGSHLCEDAGAWTYVFK